VQEEIETAKMANNASGKNIFLIRLMIVYELKAHYKNDE